MTPLFNHYPHYLQPVMMGNFNFDESGEESIIIPIIQLQQ